MVKSASPLPIGHRVRAQRKALKLTQSDLAERLEISASYVNLIEHDKRAISGSLLRRFTEALELEAGSLDGAEERRLLQDLSEAATEPELSELELTDASARRLLAQHEPWARAVAALQRARAMDRRLIAALSDRLNHDPALSASTHEMLSSAAALRSASEILIDTQDLSTDERARFETIIGEESERIATAAGALAGTFDQASLRMAGWSAAEEVDDLLVNNQNHFPVLEEAAHALDMPHFTDDASLAGMLENRHGILVRSSDDPGLSASGRLASRLDRSAKSLTLAQWSNRASRRFAIARAMAELECAEQVDEALNVAPELTSDEARYHARMALFSYVAAAALMPYDEFHAMAEEKRYDIDALTIAFSVSPEQLCHRFTTLSRSGQEGVPFAMVRANAAGYLTKRFPLPRLPIPRYGGACPLWALYAASQTPDLRVRQVAEFPSGERFLFLARTTRPAPLSFGRNRPAHTLLLACDIVHAERLVYSDGLDLKEAPEPVGPTCMLCPRKDCAHRQEEQLRKTA